MQTTVLIVHTLIALGIIILVLLQRGKGAEAGAAFGAGASGTVFGARGSTNFFSRTTAILATAFFATSLALAWISSQATGDRDSLIEDVGTEEAVEMPQAAPADDEVPSLPEAADTAPEPIDASVPPLETEPAEEEAPPEE
jgi:preprotein translocase subunit SecG